MTVSELVDSLLDKLVSGKLKGNERLADSGLFEVTGINIVPAFNDTQYVQLTSNDYDEAQRS